MNLSEAKIWKAREIIKNIADAKKKDYSLSNTMRKKSDAIYRKYPKLSDALAVGTYNRTKQIAKKRGEDKGML